MKAAVGVTAALLLVALFAATADAKCYGGAFFGHFRGHWYDTNSDAESALVIVPDSGKKIKIYDFRTTNAAATGKHFFVGRGGTIANAKTALDGRAGGTLSTSHDPAGGLPALYSIASTDVIDENKEAQFELDLGGANTDYTGGVNGNKAAEPGKASDVLWLWLHETGGPTNLGFVEFVPFLRSGQFKRHGSIAAGYARVTIENSEASAFATADQVAFTGGPANVRYFGGTKPYEQSYMELIKLGETESKPDKGIYLLSTGGAITDLNTGSPFGTGRTAKDMKWIAVYQSQTALKRVLTYMTNCD